MEITEFEKKRAANLIWNGAQDYTIEPGFRVYDTEGHADVYWNSIVGAAHNIFRWDLLENFYHTFHETVNQGVYESIFWLAVENATYETQRQTRPVFPYLRKAYAERQLEALHGQFSLEDSAGQRLLAITMGHFRRAAGLDTGLPDLVDVRLLDEIEVPAGVTTDAFIDRVGHALHVYLGYHIPGESEEPRKEHYVPSLEGLLGLIRRKAMARPERLQPIRKLSFGYGEHVKEYGSEILDQSHLSVAFAMYTAQSDEGLRKYIETSFGKPIYSDQEVRRFEKDYCWGNHTDVKLYFTDGAYTDEMLEDGYAGKMKKEGILQARKNRDVYNAQAAVHRVQIERLTNRIRNALLTHMEDSQVAAETGRISARRVWRGLYLNETKVFDKVLPGDDGDITVDILLDASTSQLHRQETVAAQGYMIAEALTACGIPTKVYSFCSMNGYTITTVYREYDRLGNNENIFRFFTAGANRDGLAIRLAAGFMKDNHANHRILIVLSDCKPNDVLKIRTSVGTYEDYATDVAIDDTASEVHKARMQGIKVLSVYTGPEEDVTNAQRIYDRGFVRIHSLDMFADTVGSMIQNEITAF